ncbi:MAG: 5'/3'-nucleotidase SurE, partial [Nitrospirae bacterium]
GIYSEGIAALAASLESLGDVYVVAPEYEQSAVGHALTLHRPLRVRQIGKQRFCINGTPTDCVAIGVHKIVPEKPSLIVSGINKGGNLGDDITYSGTVSAAMEGTLLGINSIAISLVAYRDFDFGVASSFALNICKFVLKYGLPQDTLLNVNVPNRKKVNGVRLTRQGKRVYDNAIQEMNDPWGRKHYWIGGGTPKWDAGSDTDFYVVNNGYISITPLHLDMTNYEALAYLEKELFDNEFLAV